MIERKKSTREDDDQGEQTYPLVPTQDAWGEFHDVAEEQTSQGRDASNEPGEKEQGPVRIEPPHGGSVDISIRQFGQRSF